MGQDMKVLLLAGLFFAGAVAGPTRYVPRDNASSTRVVRDPRPTAPYPYRHHHVNATTRHAPSGIVGGSGVSIHTFSRFDCTLTEYQDYVACRVPEERPLVQETDDGNTLETGDGSRPGSFAGKTMSGDTRPSPTPTPSPVPTPPPLSTSAPPPSPSPAHPPGHELGGIIASIMGGPDRVGGSTSSGSSPGVDSSGGPATDSGPSGGESTSGSSRTGSDSNGQSGTSDGDGAPPAQVNGATGKPPIPAVYLQASQATDVVIQGQTLAPGNSAVIDGRSVTYAADGKSIQVDGKTYATTRSNGAAPDSIIAGGLIVQPSVTQAFVAAGQTLAPGAAVDIDGTLYVAGPKPTNGPVLVPSGDVSYIVVGTHIIPITQGSDGNVIVDGKTLTAGAVATDGATTFSASPGMVTALAVGINGVSNTILLGGGSAEATATSPTANGRLDAATSGLQTASALIPGPTSSAVHSGTDELHKGGSVVGSAAMCIAWALGALLL